MSEISTPISRRVLLPLALLGSYGIGLAQGIFHGKDQSTKPVAVVSPAAVKALSPERPLPPSTDEQATKIARQGKVGNYYHGYMVFERKGYLPQVAKNPLMVSRVPGLESKKLEDYDFYTFKANKDSDSGATTVSPVKLNILAAIDRSVSTYDPYLGDPSIHRVAVKPAYVPEDFDPNAEIQRLDPTDLSEFVKYNYRQYGNLLMQPPSSNNESEGLIEPVGVLLNAQPR